MFSDYQECLDSGRYEMWRQLSGLCKWQGLYLPRRLFEKWAPVDLNEVDTFIEEAFRKAIKIRNWAELRGFTEELGPLWRMEMGMVPTIPRWVARLTGALGPFKGHSIYIPGWMDWRYEVLMKGLGFEKMGSWWCSEAEVSEIYESPWLLKVEGMPIESNYRFFRTRVEDRDVVIAMYCGPDGDIRSVTAFSEYSLFIGMETSRWIETYRQFF